MSGSIPKPETTSSRSPSRSDAIASPTSDIDVGVVVVEHTAKAPALVFRHVAKRLGPGVAQVVVTNGIEPRVANGQQLNVLDCRELLREAMMQAIGLDGRSALTGPRQQIESHA